VPFIVSPRVSRSCISIGGGALVVWPAGVENILASGEVPKVTSSTPNSKNPPGLGRTRDHRHSVTVSVDASSSIHPVRTPTRTVSVSQFAVRSFAGSHSRTIIASIVELAFGTAFVSQVHGRSQFAVGSRITAPISGSGRSISGRVGCLNNEGLRVRRGGRGNTGRGG